MAFDLHIAVNKKELPATISLRQRKAGVACYLSVRVDALKNIGATEKSAFDVLIGSAEDIGKLRLRVNKDGRAHGRKMRDFLILNLGTVAAFPNHEVDKQRCDAKPVDGQTLEIALPDWSALADDDVEDEPSPRPSPAASKPSSPKPAPALVRNGISVDLTFDNESVTYNKKTMDLTTRQAAVLAALLRAMPSNVGREWLCKNLMTDVASHMRDVSLDMVFRDLTKALGGVGLDVKVTPKVGAALVIK